MAISETILNQSIHLAMTTYHADDTKGTSSFTADAILILRNIIMWLHVVQLDRRISTADD